MAEPSSTERLYQILGHLHEAVVLADEHAVVQYVNPSYTRMTGLLPKDIVGRLITDVRSGSVMPEVVRTGVSQLGVYREQGGSKYISNVVPLLEDGKVIGAISMANEVSEIVRISKELEQTQRIVSNLKQTVKQTAKYTFDSIVAGDPATLEVKALARKIADRDVNVLIEGESGTGKELYAQAIHSHSSRKYAPFIPVNCATLDSSLLDTELFGYDDASFTGAKKGGKPGVFEMASGGTVFLDEIGELAPPLQAKLLRVLQEGRVRPVGGAVEREVDVRVIAATNRDLERMVQDKLFRADLYYRLATVLLRIPPLRERKGDIPPLIQLFLQKESDAVRSPITLDEAAVPVLTSYDWPGNVRELQNTIVAGAVFADRGVIGLEDLPRAIYAHGLRSSMVDVSSIADAVKRAEQEEIRKALVKYGTHTQGKRDAARALGISVATLYNRLKEQSEPEL